MTQKFLNTKNKFSLFLKAIKKFHVIAKKPNALNSIAIASIKEKYAMKNASVKIVKI
jgi:hypothetical protein